MGHPGWRAAALLAVAAILPVTGALVTGVGAGAAAAQTPPPPTVPGITSTTTTPPTTAPPSPSTTAPSGSGSSGGGGGKPNVPTGGPPTTAPPKPGTPPPPPPDPKPILTAVDADMTQLTAIAEYPQAVSNVSAQQQALTAAEAGVQSAQVVLYLTSQTEAAASQRVESASTRLEHLAIAAYIGVGYATPAAGPQGLEGGITTVNTPGGMTGSVGTDAQEMLTLVAQHVRKEVANTRRGLDRAKKATQGAAAGVSQALAGVTAAQAALQASQNALAVLTKAATVPGVAAQVGLLGLPIVDGGASGAPSSTPTTTGSQTAAPKGGSQPMPGAAYAAATKPAAPVAPPILGAALLTPQDLAAWYTSTGHTANTTVPIAQLAADYATAGQATGVRYDVAFAQSIVETGFFSFPAGGQLTSADNNFAGIGACDSCSHGWTFPDAQTGVSAQLELLEAYASPTPVKTPLIGSVGVGGCCPDWMALAGKWATSTVYGISIMTIYQQMLAWAIPQRLTAAGLTAPAAPAVSKGPSLAKLPAGSPSH